MLGDFYYRELNSRSVNQIFQVGDIVKNVNPLMGYGKLIVTSIYTNLNTNASRYLLSSGNIVNQSDIAFFYKKDEKLFNEQKLMKEESKVKDGFGNFILSADAVRMADGKYYSKNLKTVKVDGYGYLPEGHKDIVTDCATGELIYVPSSKSVINQLVKTTQGDRTLWVGIRQQPYAYCSKNNLKYLPEYVDAAGNKFQVDSVKTLEQAGFIEDVKSGLWFESDLIRKAITEDRQGKFTEFTNTKKATGDKVVDMKNGTYSPTFLSTDGLRYTFGVEWECTDLVMPGYAYKDLNCLLVRDGSIHSVDGSKYGLEIVTGVLQGDSGMMQVQKICNQINKRGLINKECGLHVHIGGATFNKQFIVLAYKLGQLLEKDFFSIVSPSRRNNQYCRNLPNMNIVLNNIESPQDFNIRVDNYYTDIFKLITKSNPSKSQNKAKPHPRGPKCGYDHSSPRYCWLNFVPAVCDTRNNPKALTLEFRHHQGTLNSVKSRNWVKICMAFVAFVENYASSIMDEYITVGNKKLPITLDNVISAIMPNQSKKLLQYIEERRACFAVAEAGAKKEQAEYSEKEVAEAISIKQLVTR
jgi:hypothetical protein